VLQAAVLAYGIAEGQQFIDGNKRTALVAMLTFLEINGMEVDASDPELADWAAADDVERLNLETQPPDHSRCRSGSPAVPPFGLGQTAVDGKLRPKRY
jgi:prophage maintenance system killer protein